MKRKKLISVLMGSMLILSTGTPTALAEPIDETILPLSEKEEINISLDELINEVEKNSEVDDTYDIKLALFDDFVHLFGTVGDTYIIEIEGTSEPIEVFNQGSQIDIQMSLEELVENNIILKMIHNDSEQKTNEVELAVLLNSYINDTEENPSLNEEETPAIHESSSDFQNEVDDLTDQENSDKFEEKTKDDSTQIYEIEDFNEQEVVEGKDIDENNAEEIADLKENLAEEPVEEYYEIKEYDDSSSEYSFPRESSVEELLHGEESSEVEREQTPRMRMFSAFSTRTANSDGTYTVKSGDTFNAIASSFNLSVRQLREWNTHVTNINVVPVGTRLAVARKGAEEILSPSDKARLYNGGATSSFSSPQQFIDDIAPRAINIANQDGQEGLWPSLMIAQAAHESNYGRSALGSSPYHNLSGIKGSHNGNSVLMWTWEVYGGQRVNVLANFRQYPSYDASLQDYANLLRNGLSWNRNYYSGTWRSNTNSVWDVLNNNGLRGYATDPNYFAAIRRIINQYDLTQYDTGNHYYVRTGTFLGEEFTNIQMNRLKNENSQYSYRMGRDENKTPYSYRRIQSTKEFLGEAGAQRVIDQLRTEKGWSASMVPSGNSTQRHRVRSGFFNTMGEAERALEEFRSLSGYSATIEHGSDGKFRIRTGFFNGRNSAQTGLDYMKELGWSARIIESKDSTPHYYIRTGTFNTPNHVNRAIEYFNQNGWGSNELLATKNNYYYRIYIEGFPNNSRATSYVAQLKNKYNWSSTAFLMEN